MLSVVDNTWLKALTCGRNYGSLHRVRGAHLGPIKPEHGYLGPLELWYGPGEPLGARMMRPHSLVSQRRSCRRPKNGLGHPGRTRVRGRSLSLAFSDQRVQHLAGEAEHDRSEASCSCHGCRRTDGRKRTWHSTRSIVGSLRCALILRAETKSFIHPFYLFRATVSHKLNYPL